MIPNSVTSIGERAFEFCSRLTNVTIGTGVTGIGLNAFFRCDRLVAFSVAPLNTAYDSLEGVLLTKSHTALIRFPQGKGGSYTIPNTVTLLARYAFSYCNSLTNLNIPDSVTSIGDRAFESCANLRNVAIGSGLATIGDSAFLYCTSLTTITLPASLSNIGDYAFQSCTNLTAVYFLGNVVDDYGYAFVEANKVIVYYLPGTTGWAETFGDRPTRLWKPQVQSGGTDFGVRTNQFGFGITWVTGRVVVIEACTNLVIPIWLPLRTNTLGNEPVYFSDPQWTNYPGRFYRLRSP